MSGLHALTVRQPWADDIVSARRWLLPRARPHAHTGRVLIHAARYRPTHPSLGREAVDAPELPLGAIVGSAEIGWARVVADDAGFWERWQSGEAFIDARDETLFYPSWERYNPNRPYVDCGDQFDGGEPWAAVFTVPAPTWDRCPICWGDGCSICDGAGTCPPIGDVRGAGGLWRLQWLPGTKAGCN